MSDTTMSVFNFSQRSIRMLFCRALTTAAILHVASLSLPVAAADLLTKSAASMPNEAANGAALAIEGVTVLPMTDADTVLRDMTVILRNGRIEAVGSAKTIHIPKGVRRVSGAGKWLMPSLTDMHTHPENDRLARLLLGTEDVPNGTVRTEDIFLPYVANGVLQIVNMSAMSESIGQRIEIESGRVLGPHMALAAMVDGDPAMLPAGLSRSASTPADGRQVVRDVKADGYDFVKAYSNLDTPTFVAIVDEARKQGMRVVGHLPRKKADLSQPWLDAGYSMVVHAEEFAFQAKDVADAYAKIPEFVALAKANGLWLATTLITDERILQQMRDPAFIKNLSEPRFLHPLTRTMWVDRNGYANSPPARLALVEAITAFNRKLVKEFIDADIPVIPGTDAFLPGVAPGFSLHDEFEALARAGLTPQQILFADTRKASDFLGFGADRGTVEIGKRADLVLLDADPFEKISNTRRIVAVISNGRYYSSATLNKMLDAMAARYATMALIKPGVSAKPAVGGLDHPFEDDAY
ncbi:amidohydrolase family protein [Undibacterium sp. Rencai35W]|uniref:amidohydrolase family protein n=1 Tax=Undibacterium sp. Rencai35W TaxID=3413046 RepID=UPI003BF58625